MMKEKILDRKLSFFHIVISLPSPDVIDRVGPVNGLSILAQFISHLGHFHSHVDGKMCPLTLLV